MFIKPPAGFEGFFHVLEPRIAFQDIHIPADLAVADVSAKIRDGLCDILPVQPL